MEESSINKQHPQEYSGFFGRPILKQQNKCTLGEAQFVGSKLRLCILVAEFVPLPVPFPLSIPLSPLPLLFPFLFFLAVCLSFLTFG